MFSREMGVDVTDEVDASCELAWTRFRSRLADHLAGLGEDEALLVELQTGVDDDELEGAAPYLQFLHWGEQQLRAEAVSNAYLDERFELTGADEDRLRALGWAAAVRGEGAEQVTGDENFHVDADLRDADRIALLSVATLREVYGCAHPLFLHAEGLEHDDGWSEPGPTPVKVVEQLAVRPEGRDHLQRLVDAALEVMFEEAAHHDEDGDVPITCGLSRAFVRVSADRPVVEIFATLAVDLTDVDAAQVEVNALNRAWPHAQFFLSGDRVESRALLPAFPFAAAQLRDAVARFCGELDDLAEALVERAGGRRFLQRPLPPRARERLAADDAHPAMVGLLEMLHVDDVAVGTVASLFDHDRQELIGQLVRVRTGAQPLAGLDEERVLDHLRRALRLVADRQARAERAAERQTRQATTRQLALLSDEELGEDTLEAGWGA